MSMWERMEEKDRADHRGGPSGYDREKIIERNKQLPQSQRVPVPGNYQGYNGTVDQQPDNPQHKGDDD